MCVFSLVLLHGIADVWLPPVYCLVPTASKCTSGFGVCVCMAMSVCFCFSALCFCCCYFYVLFCLHFYYIALGCWSALCTVLFWLRSLVALKKRQQFMQWQQPCTYKHTVRMKINHAPFSCHKRNAGIT